MAPKSTIFFERDKKAYASIVVALQSRGIRPREGESPLIHTAVKKQGDYEALLSLTPSNREDGTTAPGLTLVVERLTDDGINSEVVWGIILDYQAERDDWYVYCPIGKCEYRGPKPSVDHFVPKNDQYITSENASAILKTVLDFFQGF